jgi:hypothetical protein
MDSEYLARRTEMFQNLKMEGYWEIGTGDREKVAKARGKGKSKPRPKPKPKAGRK